MAGPLDLAVNPFAPPAPVDPAAAFSHVAGPAGMSGAMADAIVASPAPPPALPTIGPSWMTAPAAAPAVPSSTGFAPLPAPAPAPAPLAPPPPAAPAPRARPAGGGGPAADNLEKQIVKTGQKAENAIDTVQEAKTEAADATAAAYNDLSVQQRMDAQELADRQDQARQVQAHLDEQDRKNLAQAKDYTIPAFWDGSQGAKVGSILSVAMGGIAAGILGGPNGALQIINKQTDDYFHQQKEKIDNLYRYAEQTGRLNTQTRLRYAQELTDLQAQHVAVQASILTRIKAVEATNTGNIDRASTDQLKAGIEQQVIEGQQKERQNQAHIGLMKAQTSEAYAKASEARAAGAAKGQGNDDKADEQAYKTYVAPHVKKSDELNRRINALNSAEAGAKNPNASYGEVISSLETGIAADAGAGVRGVSMGQLHSIIPNLVSTEGKISNAVSQGWNGKVGDEFRSATLRFIERAKQERGSEAQQNHADVKREMASTPYGQRRADFAQRAADRLYPTVGRAPAAAAAPNTVVRMRDGSVAEFDASGKRVK